MMKLRSAVLACLILLAAGMQVRGALYWQDLASTTYLHVSSGTYINYAIHGAIVVLLGFFALRRSKVAVGLLALLMAWYSQGSFATAAGLSLGAPGEREIALWSQRTALLHLLLAVAFAVYLVAMLLRNRRGHSSPASVSGEVSPNLGGPADG